MKLIYVASPLSGDVEKNIEYARDACRAVMDCGHAFFAPHLLYPSFLDDTIPEERQLGMDMGLKALAKCDELWAFGPTVSEGMRAEMEEAERLNIPVRRFELTEDLKAQEVRDPDPNGMTVEQFLREHPDTVLDLMTPSGYVTVTPEQGRTLLDGGEINAHLGVSGSWHTIEAREILGLEFVTLSQNEKDPKHFGGIVDCPVQTRAENASFSGMVMQC